MDFNDHLLMSCGYLFNEFYHSFTYLFKFVISLLSIKHSFHKTKTLFFVSINTNNNSSNSVNTKVVLNQNTSSLYHTIFIDDLAWQKYMMIISPDRIIWWLSPLTELYDDYLPWQNYMIDNKYPQALNM